MMEINGREGVAIVEGLLMLGAMFVVFWMFMSAGECEGDKIEREMDLKALEELKRGKVRKRGRVF